MRKIVDVQKQVLKVISCDRCQRDLTDELELQEAFAIAETGGYSSVFGDGSNIDLDLCQHCTKELLGEWIAIT